jgi:hypothetical protein
MPPPKYVLVADRCLQLVDRGRNSLLRCPGTGVIRSRSKTHLTVPPPWPSQLLQTQRHSCNSPRASIKDKSGARNHFLPKSIECPRSSQSRLTVNPRREKKVIRYPTVLTSSPEENFGSQTLKLVKKRSKVELCRDVPLVDCTSHFWRKQSVKRFGDLDIGQNWRPRVKSFTYTYHLLVRITTPVTRNFALPKNPLPFSTVAFHSIGHLRFSSTSSNRIVEIPATLKFSSSNESSTVLKSARSRVYEWKKSQTIPETWIQMKRELDLQTSSTKWTPKELSKTGFELIQHFLPAQFPASVAPGYAQFCGFCFLASVSGSAGMVLSTQTLLLAIGVVGNAQSASVMAGALNWVLKDGIGQLGGVIFASRMGETRRFDANPKKWRMMGALCLDSASLLDILSPFAPSAVVLPLACFANALKNIGYLTVGASRAALHQALTRAGNLGDVTAKAGSQSIAAGLLGTGVGIGLSAAMGHDAGNFVLGFCGLSLIHQLCNFAALQHVDLHHFNRHRLYLVLDHYLRHGKVLSPREIATKESFFPLLREDDTASWLSIGSALTAISPGGPNELTQLLKACPDESYIINCTNDGKIHVVFLQDAQGEDLVKGMFHACFLRKKTGLSIDGVEAVVATHEETKVRFPHFLEELNRQAWNISTNVTNIESSSRAVRFIHN